jgi:hypothetical protein
VFLEKLDVFSRVLSTDRRRLRRASGGERLPAPPPDHAHSVLFQATADVRWEQAVERGARRARAARAW